jgi:glycerol-3-phosphate dehydrogenase
MGTIFLHHTKAVNFKRSRNRIQSVRMVNTQTGKEIVVKADQVINAAGAWAGEIAALAGDRIPMVYSKGSLLVTHSRITQQVINRLRRPLDGDILVPGRTVSLLGTTSIRTDSPDKVRPTVEETDFILDEIAAMIPVLETTRYIRAYAGVRPLVSLESAKDDRAVSRGYVLLDHTEIGLENLITITGGKLTTYRLMAEKAANLVCQRLGVSAPCHTRTEMLPSYEAYNWIESGESLKEWFRHHEPDDLLLCECEMVPRSAIETAIAFLREQNEKPLLNLLGTHTRMGKGACQGTFCGLRVLAYMYDHGALTSAEDSGDIRTFLRERWRGQHPVLWNGQLIQAELTEALHCGFLCMELEAGGVQK